MWGDINLRYCYLTRKATQNMLASRMRFASSSLPIIAITESKKKLLNLKMKSEKST